MSYGVDWTCECGWANLDVRKKCRNCGKEPDWKSRADSLAAELAKAREALTKIARPTSCGCVPCTGQCQSGEAIQITVDEFREIARAALPATPEPQP